MKGGPRNCTVKNGRLYWQTTKAMRALGFESQPCGRDGVRARARAGRYNREWDRERERARKAGRNMRAFTGLDVAAFVRDYGSNLEQSLERNSDFLPTMTPRQPRQSAPFIRPGAIMAGADVDW